MKRQTHNPEIRERAVRMLIEAANDNLHNHSLRRQHDDFYISEIRRIWQDSKCRYGARKVWQQIKAEGTHVARCTVECLMEQYKLQDVWRGKGKTTTHSHDDQKRADSLVNRNSNAHLPNPIWPI